MTDEQIDRRIAELTNCAGHGNYCSDLNAMHDAEMILPIKKMMIYLKHLEKINGCYWFCADARERAEAFLRTLGKWEEVQG